METCSPLIGMQNTRPYITSVEQNLHTVTAAVDSCRGALRLLNDELSASDNSARFYFEKSLQYYHINLSLLQEKDEMAREIERLHNGAATTHTDILQLNELNEILQKRIFELERLQDNRSIEMRNLKAKISYLETGKSGTRWPSPIRVKFPYEDGQPPSLSPESVLDLTAEGSELVDISLSCGGIK